MMNNFKYVLFLTALLGLAAWSTQTTGAGKSDTPPSFPLDIFKFKRITHVSVSPDSRIVAYSTFSLKTTSQEKYWENQLYLKTAHEKPVVLATSRDTIASPLWSCDGKNLAYLTKNSHTHQTTLWIFNIQQQSTHKLFTFKHDIVAFKWSPDGKRMAFIAEDMTPTLSESLQGPIDVSKDYVNMRLYLVATRTQKQPRFIPLTSADDSVTCEISGVGFDWSPDGKSIAFAHLPRIGFDYLSQSKISLIDLATHHVTPIPYTETHTGVNPVFSPDRKWLAFASNNPSPGTSAQELSNEIALNSRICVTDLMHLDHTTCLSNTPNENPYIIHWDKDSQGIFVYDVYKTEGPQIYFLSLEASAEVKLISSPKGYLSPLTISLNQHHTTFGFSFETVNHPPEVYVSEVNLKSLQLRPISHLSQSPQTPLGQIEKIHWNSKDGKEIEGLLITPRDYNPKQKYPLYVMVHGGPYQIAWAERYLGRSEEFGLRLFDPTSYISAALSQGFVVFQPNYRGSNGYGKSFRLANFGNYGGLDYQDIISGVDYLVNAGIADNAHMAIAGWSYGGFMTSFAIGQSDRFQAAIDGAGISNMISFAGTSDIPELTKKDLGSYFWDNETLYWQQSPLSHVKNIHTPVLIVHGKSDTRVPVSQAYELYQALRLQHKPVTLLIFPGEDHIFANPNMIWAALEAIYQWLQKAL